ncbi:uncharacterized protein LOC117297467 isoform X2 [Asterias rubens]|uniref:uncharacterized protein LOC117297467 isoform X2 n=1 Tax=Asterias rubens TaxID=7604 RepID=UPI0014552505|nr:uncharacterized protein LOC117297467 isoform X2 [Asterias rubens]
METEIPSEKQSQDKLIINGCSSNVENRVKVVTDVVVPAKTLNKETLTPWSDVEGFQPKIASAKDSNKFKMESTDLNEVSSMQDSNPSPWGNVDNTNDDIAHSTNGNGPEWSVTHSSSDWPAVSNGDVGTSLEDQTKDAKLVWGDVQNGEQQASHIEDADLQIHSADAGKSQATQDGSFANPFAQDSGFVDNFCEMLETDLIFKSGLVDEEFKTICVTAEEDDLWSSSFTAPADQSVSSPSWDPFSSNQNPALTEPVPAMQTSPDDQTSVDEITLKLSNDVAEPSCSDLREQPMQVPVTSIPQPKTTQYSTSIVLPQDTSQQSTTTLSTNHSAHQHHIPANRDQALGSKPKTNLNIGQMLQNTAFKEVILDESWMSETDCLETKAFTVDLNQRSTKKDAEEPTTTSMNTMDLLSDQPIGSGDSSADVAMTSSNGQPELWMASNGESLKTPADINANMEQHGQVQTDNLLDFGDAKMVVAPPPEFDNNFDFVPNSVEINNTHDASVSLSGDQSNGDLLAFLGSPQDVVVVETGNKPTTRVRTPSDLDAFLNELGDGTTIDDEEDASMNSGEDTNISEQDLKYSRKLEEENFSENPSEDNAKSIEMAEEEILVDTSVLAQESVPAEEVVDLSELEGESFPVNPSEQCLILNKMAEEDTLVDSSVLMQESVPAEEVVDRSAMMQENLQELSNDINGLLSIASESEEASMANITQNSEDSEDVTNDNKDHMETETKVSVTSIKLDLTAKRRSFFGDEDVPSDLVFQPQISNASAVVSPTSVNLSSALPTVPVLPKVQTTYQRPETKYETKPRAATDSFVSSHALLGLGGDQVVLTDTKPRSVSGPPPSSLVSEGISNLRKHDPSVSVKSDKFIRALYGPKPGSKSSELVDEDGKTLFEYEKERRDVLDAMKVKRKKKVSWQKDSLSEDLTSPESEEPSSPIAKTEIPVPSPRTTSLIHQDATADSEFSETAPTPEPETVTSIIPLVENPQLPSNGDVLEGEHQTVCLESPCLTVEVDPVDKRPSTEEEAVVTSPRKTDEIFNLNSEKETVTSALSVQPAEVSETLPEQTAENTNVAEVKEEVTPIDLGKMRSLWEQKLTTASGQNAETQQLKKNVKPRRMFSFEAKAKEAASHEEKLQKEKKEKAKLMIEIPAEPDIMDTMPKDPDDDFDRSDSYSYDVTPTRKVEIQSHWAKSESVIERDIRLQKEREQELLKEGLLKHKTEQSPVVKLEIQNKSDKEAVSVHETIVEREVRLQRERDENDAKERKMIRQMSSSRQSSLISPCAPSEKPVSTSPTLIQQKNIATTVKPAEPEICRQQSQQQEAAPQELLMGSPELEVIIRDKEDQSKPHNVTEEKSIIRRESIVQREIRLQKERDEANVLERQKALQETQVKHASIDSPLSSSGRSTPKVPQSPVKQSATFTPIKLVSPQVDPKSPEVPLNVSAKTPQKSSPSVKFGLQTGSSDPYKSYREYQNMLRGRRSNEKHGEKAGPMKATEGSVSIGQSPVSFRESLMNKSAQARPPSPLLQRPASPVQFQPASPVMKQEEPREKDTVAPPQSKAETPVQREIRLAKEREADHERESLASTHISSPKRGPTPLKAVHTPAFADDIPNVVIVEKSDVTEMSKVTTESPKVTDSMTLLEKEVVVMRRKKETPMERDIRLAEEREMVLRKEREATLSPVKKIRGPQSESLIEREIRRQQEKEQEFRREKGLVSSSAAEALTNTETEGVTDAGEQVEIAKDQETAKKEVTPAKYRPQRRSLVLAQQWEQMFK